MNIYPCTRKWHACKIRQGKSELGDSNRPYLQVENRLTMKENSIVASRGGVCEQKTSKFFVSHGEESITGHVGVNRVY
jgi:hypothetical protein